MNRVFLAVIVVAIGMGCSSSGMNATDGGTTDEPDDRGLDEADVGRHESDAGSDVGNVGSDAGVSMGSDAGPSNMVACRVRLDDALSPCAPTVAEQVTRQQGTPFGDYYLCPGGYPLFTSYQEGDHLWQCVYDGSGALVAWDRTENGQQFCDGRASGAVGDIYSMYQLIDCLAVDDGTWTWIQSFDPGPTAISIQVGAGTTIVRSQTIDVGLGFVLSGQEIAASDLTMRYWYTADPSGGSPPIQSAICNGTNGLACDDVTISLIPVTPPRPPADTYAEVAFPNFPGIMSTGFLFSLGFLITRTDGLYDQSNDYSYNGPSQATPTTKVTAYVKGVLIYGTEP
jgi:hypothetical protein